MANCFVCGDDVAGNLLATGLSRLFREHGDSVEALQAFCVANAEVVTRWLGTHRKQWKYHTLQSVQDEWVLSAEQSALLKALTLWSSRVAELPRVVSWLLVERRVLLPACGSEEMRFPLARLVLLTGSEMFVRHMFDNVPELQFPGPYSLASNDDGTTCSNATSMCWDVAWEVLHAPEDRRILSRMLLRQAWEQGWLDQLRLCLAEFRESDIAVDLADVWTSNLVIKTFYRSLTCRRMATAHLFFRALPILYTSPVAIVLGVMRVLDRSDPRAKYLRERIASEGDFQRAHNYLHIEYGCEKSTYAQFLEREDAIWARKLRQQLRIRFLVWRRAVRKISNSV